MRIQRSAIVMMIVFSLSAFAAKTEMTYEQYQTELQSAQQREKTAREQIAQEQAAIETLKQQLIDIEQKIAMIVQEKYTILGITEQDVLAAENEIASIRQSLEQLQSLTSNELRLRMKEISALESRLTAVHQKPVSYLWRVRDKLAEADALLQNVKALANEKPVAATSGGGSYTVQLIPENRDCLSKIAGYNYVLGDRSKWPLLYKANRDVIDRYYERYKKKIPESKYQNPEDLIFPGQILTVPQSY